MMLWVYGLSIAFLLTCSFVWLPWAWLKETVQKVSLKLGGWLYRRAPQQWQIAWQSVSYPEHRLTALLVLIVVAMLLGVAEGRLQGLLVMTTVALALGFTMPLFRAQRRLNDTRSRIVAALPAQLDLLAMLLVAGQPLLSSLQLSSSSGIDNPLREELRNVVNQIRAGAPVDVAFERLSRRYPCRELRLFCSALHHARESGGGLAGILYEQAEQRRHELFLSAEKKAMEAPVKLMFPLLVFIFPGTVLVLVVTLAAKMMWNL